MTTCQDKVNQNLLMLSISTAWNYAETCDLRHMLNDIKSLGINSIELGYSFSLERLEELIPLLKEFNMSVSSVHNFCPLPEQNVFGRFFTNYYYLSALNEMERRAAVFYTNKTIDTAKRAGAKVVVIHAGTIDLNNAYLKELIILYNKGDIKTEKANNIRKQFSKARLYKKKPYLEACRKSLDEITRYAESLNIKIGLENRYYPNEIPDLQEALDFLNEFNSRGLVYWHDLGHACAQEHLMITEKNSLLDRLAKHLFGFHLHNIEGLKDHLSPLKGEFDILRLSAYLQDDKILKVIESHQPTQAAEIEAVIRYFKAQNWL